jgi:protein SCO1/2
MAKQEGTGRSALLWIVVTVLFLAIGGAGGWLVSNSMTPTKAGPPIMFRSPNYSGLINQNGATVSSAAFRGKVQLVTFLFPYCNTFCPIIAAHLVGFENMLLKTDLADRVEIVSFNVDPAGTGPKEMNAFLKQYGWDPASPHWQYLTGAPKEIRHVVTDGYHVAYVKVADSGSGGDDASAALAVAGSDPQPIVANPLADKAHVHYDITHEDTLMIVDPKGRVRFIHSQADAVGKLTLLKEVRAVLASSR